MKKLFNLACGCALSLALVVPVAVYATTSYVDGGTWNYGIGVLGAYSDYYHVSRDHGSSVYSADRSKSDSDISMAGDWSNALLGAYWGTGCSYYYRFLD